MDVLDVADAHVRAVDVAEAGGKRLILACSKSMLSSNSKAGIKVICTVRGVQVARLSCALLNRFT